MRFGRKGSEEICGFLDKGTNVTGELEFAGTLRIDGNFRGAIATSGVLVIGGHALVHADIRAGRIDVHGQIFGNVTCQDRLEIASTGCVRGDVHTPVLTMQAGATLDGRICMADEKPGETTVAARETAHQLARHNKI